MEEADTIVIGQIRELGIPVERGISTIREFIASDSSLVYEVLATYMRLIDPSKSEGIQESLPTQMRQRVGSCTALARAMKEFGYKGELNYHQILYPSEDTVRHMLIWFAEVLPKHREDMSRAKEAEALLRESISREFVVLNKQPWTLSALEKTKLSEEFSTMKLVTPNRGRILRTTPGLEKYYCNILGLTSHQVNKIGDFSPSVFETNLQEVVSAREKEQEWNQIGLESGLNPIQYRKEKKKTLLQNMAASLRMALDKGNERSESGGGGGNGRKVNDELNELMRDYEEAAQASKSFQTTGAGGLFSRQTHFSTEETNFSETDLSKPKETIEDRIEKQKEELRSLDEKIGALRELNIAIKEETQAYFNQQRQLESNSVEEDNKRLGLEKDYLVKKRTFDLLPEADGNIRELQGIAASAAGKIITLATEWEKHRIPLLQKIRKLRNVESDKLAISKQQIAEVQIMRAEMKKIVTEINQKDERYTQLVEVYKRLPQSQNRGTYTRRIIEIVKNVKKQKVDIDKILHDTRNLQKEMNTVEDALSRVCASTDEMLFVEAKKESKIRFAKDAYQHYASITGSFSSLIDIYEKLGTTRNALLNLEAKLEQVQNRVNSLNMKQVEDDLKQIKSENNLLQSKIQEH